MMNPLIYGLSHKLLYRELKVLLGSCCCCLCWCCGGGTRADSLTDLEDMRRRQAEGTYDKEGIYLGKVRVGVCTCNGCVMSRREMTILAQLHKTTTSTTTATTANNNYNSSINNLSHNTCSIALVEECPNPTPSAAATPETDRQTESSSVCYDSLDRDKALVTLPPLTATDLPIPSLPPSPHTPTERQTRDKISVDLTNKDKNNVDSATNKDRKTATAKISEALKATGKISDDFKAMNMNSVDLGPTDDRKTGTDQVSVSLTDTEEKAQADKVFKASPATEEKKSKMNENSEDTEKHGTAAQNSEDLRASSKFPVDLRSPQEQKKVMNKISVALIETEKEKMEMGKISEDAI